MQNNKNIDKVNMSLDDIIKLNRNQSRQNKFSANRSLNNNNGNKNQNRNNFNNGNRKNNNINRKNHQQQQPQNQRVNNKPYGLLNKSKIIQKRNLNRNQNVIILKNQQGNQQQQFQTGRRFPRNLNNRRRRLPNVNGAPQRLFNRFGTSNGNKTQQNGQKQKRNNQQQQIRVNKFVNKPVLNRIQQVRQRRTQQLRQPIKSAKIAMQSARKNVMKAKRLLATKTARKGPIQQIMTQRYAKSLGLVQKPGGQIRRNNMVKSLNKAKAQRPSNKMLTININNRVNKTNRVKQVQKQKLQKSVQLVKQQFKKPQGQQATKRPILNRNRPQQGQTSVGGGGRKVFF